MKLIGTLLIISGVLIVFLIYGPYIKAEIEYLSMEWQGLHYSLDAPPQFTGTGTRVIYPVNKDFAVVIPKINVNSPVIPQINPNDPADYLPALREGVAQARGSQTPDENGNLFLFGHSADAFYNVARYNAVFFLLGKLQAGDEVSVYYQGQRYRYEVIETGVMMPEYLTDYVKEKTTGLRRSVALQTCYPPGTTWKRLVVIAKQLQ